jgi:hypothetical protein
MADSLVDRSDARLEEEVARISKKLDLNKAGLTNAEAERIINPKHVPVVVPYTLLSLLAICVVLIVVILLYIVMKHKIDNYRRPWEICDKWVDTNTLREYTIFGYDNEKCIAKANGPFGTFTIGYDTDNDTFESSMIGLNNGILRGNILRWNNAIWMREIST